MDRTDHTAVALGLSPDPLRSQRSVFARRGTVSSELLVAPLRVATSVSSSRIPGRDRPRAMAARTMRALASASERGLWWMSGMPRSAHATGKRPLPLPHRLLGKKVGAHDPNRRWLHRRLSALRVKDSNIERHIVCCDEANVVQDPQQIGPDRDESRRGIG